MLQKITSIKGYRQSGKTTELIKQANAKKDNALFIVATSDSLCEGIMNNIDTRLHKDGLDKDINVMFVSYLGGAPRIHNVVRPLDNKKEMSIFIDNIDIIKSVTFQPYETFILDNIGNAVTSLFAEINSDIRNDKPVDSDTNPWCEPDLNISYTYTETIELMQTSMYGQFNGMPENFNDMGMNSGSPFGVPRRQEYSRRTPGQPQHQYGRAPQAPDGQI